MFRSLTRLALVFVLSPPMPSAQAQFAGSRGGNEGDPSGQMAERSFDPPPLDPKVAVSYITLDGRAEARVRPSEIRIVLAVTAEAESAGKCQESVAATVDHLKAAWTKMNIPPENIFVDFIAVLPRYKWTLEQREGTEVGVEKKAGYHMQSNVHLAVPDNAHAEAVLAAAFAEGVTDIIAFDYWSRGLDEAKAKVRQEAVKAARAKADTLLGLFKDRLPIINVQEKTTVRYPDSMYASFRASYEQTITPNWRNNVPMIQAERPRNTYYRGLNTDGDIQPRELPMRPEISVVSTVRLDFRSPAAETMKKETPKPNEK